MLTARYRQSWEDSLTYQISMSRWLGAGEEVRQVQRIDTQVEGFVTSEIRIDPVNQEWFSFRASGGRPGFIIPVRFLVTTSADQRKVIELEFAINWPRGLPMLPPGGPPAPPPGNGNGGSLDVGEFDSDDNTGNCVIGR